MPDFISGVMASPLYRTVGFNLMEIAAVTKLYGIWVGIAGGFVGGWAMARFGLFPTLLVGAFLGAASNLAFSWLSFGGPEVWRLTAAISIENFCGSFAGMALIAYMSSLTAPGLRGDAVRAVLLALRAAGQARGGHLRLHRGGLRLPGLLRLDRGGRHPGGGPLPAVGRAGERRAAPRRPDGCGRRGGRDESAGTIRGAPALLPPAGLPAPRAAIETPGIHG